MVWFLISDWIYKLPSPGANRALDSLILSINCPTTLPAKKYPLDFRQTDIVFFTLSACKSDRQS